MAAPLQLRFKKKNDGTAVITATRADGTSTYHTIGPASGYGPAHDFCHYAVETYFGIARGFFGLLVEGWNIEDFETGVRGPVPEQAAFAERLAGALSQNVAQIRRIGGHRFSAADINLTVGEAAFTEEQLHELEERVMALVAAWRALPHGEAFELAFEPGVKCSRTTASAR